jgi:uncharacterized protein
MASLAPERVRSLIRRHGADRVVFGSDWPMADPAAEIQAVRLLGLSDDETAGILGGNFLRLLGRQVRPAAAAHDVPTPGSNGAMKLWAISRWRSAVPRCGSG